MRKQKQHRYEVLVKIPHVRKVLHYLAKSQRHTPHHPQLILLTMGHVRLQKPLDQHYMN